MHYTQHTYAVVWRQYYNYYLIESGAQLTDAGESEAADDEDDRLQRVRVDDRSQTA